MRIIYHILALLIIVLSIFLLIGQKAVYRYAALTFDPEPMLTSDSEHSDWAMQATGAYQKQSDTWRFRAYEPDATLQIRSKIKNLGSVFEIENIHPAATFSVSNNDVQINQTQSELIRKVEFSGLNAGESIVLHWAFPAKTSYRFAAFGDSGGGTELDWGLIRAQQLDADFVLHLGDAYYDKSSVGTVGERLNQSKVPVYMANGNHDFRGPTGNSIDVFLNNVGPLNARFTLLDHCFINLDTGAYMYPPHKGERAAMLAAEIATPSDCREYIVFTHKPILEDFDVDFPQREHSLHRYHGRWLIDQLTKLGKVTIMAGHIHRDFEFEQDGIKTFVSGNGLAQTDLREPPETALFLMGEITKGEPLRTVWETNNMPMSYRCSEKVRKALKNTNNKHLPLVDDACRPRADKEYK